MEDEGILSIQADNENLSASVDDTDLVEITGSCQDLDRKKNRILVEVFTGDDETIVPYISNAISDRCQTTASGLPTTDKCFWVTQGLGLVEDAGLITERSFPQCHNGRFSFTVKLGQILTNVAPPSLRYTVRFKLRTLEGLLVDSQWSRVSVTRELNTPAITGIAIQNNPPSTDVNPTFACTVSTSAARFNQNITYTLSRTHRNSLNATDTFNLFLNMTTFFTTTNDSVFVWRDDNLPTGVTHAAPNSIPGILSGVTYTYTLTSNYANAPFVANSKTSNTATCQLPAPVIVPVGTTVLAGECHVSLSDASNPATPSAPPQLNPALFMAPPRAEIEWARSTTAGWTGDGFANVASSGGITLTRGNCNTAAAPALNLSCRNTGLVAGTTYYYAAREIDLATGNHVGRWSNIIACRPP